MDVKRVVFLAFVSVLLLMFMDGGELVMTASSSTAHDVYPGQSIQEAINSAQSGDTVFVHAGTYYENVVVNKSVLLIGENESTTIVDGNGTGNVIEVTANSVKIIGFTVQNSGLQDSGIALDYSSGSNISHNIIKNNSHGIDLFNSNNNILTGNNISKNGDGIKFAGDSSNNVLTGNTVSSNNRSGIMFVGYDNNNNVLTGNNVSSNNQYGICLAASDNSTITGNTVSNNWKGIWFGGSSNNTLVGNTVSNNRIGIDIGGSSNNVLTSNIVSSNSEVGISIFRSSNNVLAGNNITDNGYRIPFDNFTIHGCGIILSVCENITIYHNNFIDNAIQAYNDIVSTNFWDFRGEGNYWSDYEGVDRDGDGMGDSPYVIDENNRDRHPLMRPWTPTWHPNPLWMRWWFWTILIVGIAAALVGAVYFRKKAARGRLQEANVYPIQHSLVIFVKLLFKLY